MKSINRTKFEALIKERQPVIDTGSGVNIRISTETALDWFDRSVSHGINGYIASTEGFTWIGVGSDSGFDDLMIVEGQQ